MNSFIINLWPLKAHSCVRVREQGRSVLFPVTLTNDLNYLFALVYVVMTITGNRNENKDKHGQ